MAFYSRLASLLQRPDRTPENLAGWAGRIAGGGPDLLLRARMIVDSLRAGPYPQRRAGSGERFWQHRPYRPGDPVRMIDWKSSARTDDVLVLQREHQSMQTMALYCPHTAAMDFSPRPAGLARAAAAATDVRGESKYERALLLCACLMQVFQESHHPFCAMTAENAAGRNRLGTSDAHMMRQLEQLIAENDKSADILSAPSRSHVVWIGDFWDTLESIEARFLALLDRGCQVYAVQVFTKDERTLPYSGHIDFRTMEDTDHADIPQAEGIREAYRDRIAAHLDAFERLCERLGIAYVAHEMNGKPEDQDNAVAASLWALMQMMSITRLGRMT